MSGCDACVGMEAVAHLCQECCDDEDQCLRELRERLERAEALLREHSCTNPEFVRRLHVFLSEGEKP